MELEFDRGIFVFSLDFELAWGSRDIAGDPEELEALSRRTREEVFEPLVSMLEELEICATWATVGHLFLAGARREGGLLHPGLPTPDHDWMNEPWFAAVPEGDETSQPAWYGRSLVRRLVDAGQEIGSHGFSHVIYGDPGCSRAVAEADLARCVREAEALGVRLRSFVFPRNIVGHADLLPRYGFTCWRSAEPAWFRRPELPRVVERVGHLAEQATGRPAPTVMPGPDPHGLWEIPASTVFLPIDGARRLLPLERRVQRCTGGLDRAAAERRVFHLYTHPINLAVAPGPMLSAFRQMLEHAARMRDRGRLDILSMAEVAGRAQSMAAWNHNPGLISTVCTVLRRISR